MHPFLKQLLSCLFGFYLVLPVWSQGFTIDQYDVTLDVEKNGVIHVTEDILVNFSTQKHGIFRDIPIDYPTREDKGLKALNRIGQTEYHLIIDAVEVADKEYRAFKDNGNLSIQIGSQEVYEEGQVRYLISYTVYDVVNRFIGYDEIYWNLTGNDWPTPVGDVNYTINLPAAIPFGEDDLAVFTGKMGVSGHAATISAKGKTISGKTTRPMELGEGVTIGIRFPWNYFKIEDIPLKVYASNFFIEELNLHYTLQPDGIIQVKALVTTEAKHANVDLDLRIPTQNGGSLLPGVPMSIERKSKHGADALGEWQSVSEFLPPQSPPIELSYTPGRDHRGITAAIRSALSKKGARQQFELVANLFGALKREGDHAYAHLELLDGMITEPIGKISITFELPAGTPIEQFQLKSRYSFDSVPPHRVDGNRIIIPAFSPPSRNFVLDFGIQVPSKDFQEAPIPVRLMADNYYWDHYRQDWTLLKNGVVQVYNRAEIHSLSSYIHADVLQRTGFDNRVSSWDNSRKFNLPSYSILGKSWELAIHNFNPLQNAEFHPAFGSLAEFSFTDYDLENGQTGIMEWQYDLFGIVKSTDKGKLIHFPILFPRKEPMQDCELRIRLEDSAQMDLTQIVFRIFEGDSLLWEGPGRREGQTLVWNPPYPLQATHAVDIELVAPDSAISPSFFRSAQLLIYNNPLLFLPILMLLLLGILWFLFGRDPKITVVVDYFPPKGITPAEAGLLNDAQVQNSDLLSLIYFWAANGYLTLTEEANAHQRTSQDYTLTKVKDLPSTAHKYELTIFNNLFAGRNSVKVSALRYQFASYMAQARGELEKHGQKHRFFAPGSRGFGNFLRFMGWVFLALTGVATWYAQANPYDWAQSFSVPVGLGISCLLFFLFSRIMPKMTKQGAQFWSKVAGFKEFIATAEKDRLQQLVTEHPSYFEDTLAYAVAFGMADQWAKKFEGLSLQNPEWYHSTQRSSRDSILFTRMLMQNLSAMNREFTAVKPSPSSGGGYRSSGRSYSSYTSRSSSSGSSFRSSGSSGGGFGGGGGRSW